MADDLDNLLRAAMKTLDEQVPSGYFEGLPNQTLARLEGSMNQGPSGTTTRDQVAPQPPMTLEPDTTPVAKQEAAPAEREEDSGLHDIRNLAQSTKQRLSKKAITNAPPVADDVLAASSGSFKNIALPQPARMVSLPEIDELPSKKEVLAAEKAAEKIEKSAKKSTKEKKPEAVEAVPAIKTDLVAMPAPAAAVESHARSSFSLPSQQRKGSKGPILAILGAGVAAAAGYVIFMQVNKSEDKSSVASQSAPAAKADTAVPAAGSAAVAATPPPAPAPTVEPIPAEAPKDEAAAGAAAPAQIATDADKAEEKADVSKAAHHATKGSKTTPPKSKVEKDQKEETPKVETTKPADTTKKPTKTAGAGSGEDGEPSFDALLKEAGVQDKKAEKPKLDKKSLTGDDFKTGMSAVEGKAKACYKGTQGTALVKLTVGPTGKITKIAVAGDFASKPEAQCIAAALRGATFPPWDGGPQSFTYAVLLSD